MAELDEPDLSRMHSYQAAFRLVVDNRETAAFTLYTNRRGRWPEKRPRYGKPPQQRRRQE